MKDLTFVLFGSQGNVAAYRQRFCKENETEITMISTLNNHDFEEFQTEYFVMTAISKRIAVITNIYCYKMICRNDLHNLI